MRRRQRAQAILRVLKKSYANAGEFLTWSNPLELLIATVLSAQCTDRRVNQVTEQLFKKYRSARAYARARLDELERSIYSTGYYRSKARYLKGIGAMIQSRFGGRVPHTVGELIMLPGVSYKTAHLVMAQAFGIQSGIAVDTHVMRVASRLGLTREKSRHGIGRDLEALFPQAKYLQVNQYCILHGRAVCTPHPRCPICPVRSMCPSFRKYESSRRTRPRQAARKGVVSVGAA